MGAFTICGSLAVLAVLVGNCSLIQSMFRSMIWIRIWCHCHCDHDGYISSAIHTSFTLNLICYFFGYSPCRSFCVSTNKNLGILFNDISVLLSIMWNFFVETRYLVQRTMYLVLQIYRIHSFSKKNKKKTSLESESVIELYYGRCLSTVIYERARKYSSSLSSK